MKKLSILLVVLMGITIMFAACSSDYKWNDDVTNDIARLQESGFVIYVENTEEQVKDFTNSINYQLGQDGKDFSVELINVCCLSIDTYSIVSFEEYKTEQQAKQMYDFYHGVSSVQKLVRFGKIIISTDSEDAINLLGYDFK